MRLEIFENYLAGIAFDRVRVEIKLIRLSVDGREEIDFFFSSIITLGLIFNLDGGAFNVEIDEHNEELDLFQ